MVKAKRAVGYVRVSQVGGREGDSFLSPDVQREKIEAWATYREHEIVAWYVDLDRPAKAGDPRPEFERMMNDAKERKFDAVAVYRLTRFARSVSEAAKRYADLRELGVDLVSVTEQIDTTTASGEFVQNMLFALSEFESARIGEEWRNVHANRRRRGIANVTRPMLGYVIEKGTIAAIEPKEAECVKRIFKLRAEGRGLVSISDQLEAEGFQPKSGQRFASSTLRKIIRNPLYAGLVPLNGEVFEGAHEAVIPREEWQAIQATQVRTNTMARHRAGLLSGLMTCHSCGYKLGYGAGARKGVRVYRCPARWLSRHCERPVTINAKHAEEFVQETLLAILRRDRERMPHGGRLKRGEQSRKKRAEEARRLRTRADQLRKALDELGEARFVAGTMEAAEYARLFSTFATERDEAIAKASELEALAQAPTPPEIDLIELWPKYDFEARQCVLRLAIEQIKVVPPVAPRGSKKSNPSDRLVVTWR